MIIVLEFIMIEIIMLQNYTYILNCQKKCIHKWCSSKPERLKRFCGAVINSRRVLSMMQEEFGMSQVASVNFEEHLNIW